MGRLRTIKLAWTNALFVAFSLLFSTAYSQVKTTVDREEIRIGEEISYQLQIDTDSTDLVVFPEGQTFLPLEVIESYKVDTTFENAKMRLIKKYGLTQFDSGKYSIPQQKVIINERIFLSDSLLIEVRDVPVDTTKQKMFEIKPAIEVDSPPFDILKWLPWIVLLLLVIVGVYYFFRRKKKREEREKELPPYEEALVALQRLDNSQLLRENKSKEYYSGLTEIVKRYLDREIDDTILESTTNEIIDRMRLHKDAGHFDFESEDIGKLDSILRRADLVKFAKMQQAEEQAKEDRLAIETIINHTHEAIPEPTEEELQRNEEYLERQRKLKQRRKWILSGVGVLLLVILSGVIYGTVEGFDNLKDKVLGNELREMKEGRWYKSEYGNPALIIETPEILIRTSMAMPETENIAVKEAAVFSMGQLTDPLYVLLSINKTNNPQEDVNLDALMDISLSELESMGATNMIVKREDFETEKGIKGLRANGTFNVLVSEGKVLATDSSYELLLFAQQNAIQQVIVVYQDDGRFAEDVKDRIINSVELELQETNTN